MDLYKEVALVKPYFQHPPTVRITFLRLIYRMGITSTLLE